MKAGGTTHPPKKGVIKMSKIKTSRRLLTFLMVFVLVFALAGAAMASAPTGYVSVSLTEDNFDTGGSYVGTGTPITFGGSTTVSNVLISVADVQDAVDNDLHDEYVVGTDPQAGVATVIDAIILAAQGAGLSYDLGWDSYYGGGYISDIESSATANNVSYYQGGNGHTWANATGTGWSAAYSVNGGSMTPAASYLSNIALGSGAMDIVFDLSPYSFDWDTGLIWPNLP
jgi:hypothetical protein